MKPSPDAYTIVIFRGHTAKPWRISISRRLVRSVVAVIACLVIAEMVLLSQYVSTTGEVWELRALRDELLSARQQTTTFTSALEDLKHRLLVMKEVNHRLRVMLGIDEQRIGEPLNGQGGVERPYINAEPSTGAVPPADSDLEQKPQDRRSDADRVELTAAAAKLEQELRQLRTAALFEERRLDELAQAAKEQISRLASTPSVRPVDGWVTSGFGTRLSPFTNQLAMHEGLDIGAPMRTPVKATAGGRVVTVGYDVRMGNSIAIDHGYGIETQYGHLAKIFVKGGQKIKRGDIIGLVGNTGLSTGPHLHYMVKINDQAVNPERYILD